MSLDEHLDELIARARVLRASKGKDTQLAERLAAAATQHYGFDNRSPGFIRIIQLSSRIREVKKPEWRLEFEVLNIGNITTQQDSGYFFASQYGFGRVDLLKDMVRVNRIYGVALRLEHTDPTVGLPHYSDANFDGNRVKNLRSQELLKRIKEQMSFEPLNGSYSMLIETSGNSDSHIPLGGSIFQFFEAVSPNHDISIGTVKVLVSRGLSPIYEQFAQYHQNVRQVGRVIDGGHRYSR